MVAVIKQSLLAAAATTSLLSPGPETYDGRYRSRPELAPPQLNITVPATDATGTEYVFVAPYAYAPTDSLQRPGAYIYRKDGDLVWASTGYYAGFVANFHPTTYHGSPVLQAFQGGIDLLHGTGYGQHVLLDQNYQHVATAVAGNHRIPAIHEFNVINGETALIEIYLPTLADLSEQGGNSSQQWIADGVFQEFDIRTGDLIFEWSALEHVSPSDGLLPLNNTPANSGLTPAAAWDFIHLNSVDKNEDGDYLVSGRHTSTIYKINGTDGSIIWRLGGKHSDFTQVGGWTFGFQHHARWIYASPDGSNEVISFFDNSGDGTTNFNDVSRALVVDVDHVRNTATIRRQAEAPYNLLASSQGNAQLLPDHRLFVNWGSEGAFTEYSPENNIVYHAFIENAVSYRGFLGNWTGTPTEDPALLAVRTGSTSVTLYVSWNGDTETKSWRFYKSTSAEPGRWEFILIGEVNRESFETTLTWAPPEGVSSTAKYFVEAIGKDGKVRAQSATVKSAPEVANFL